MYSRFILIVALCALPLMFGCQSAKTTSMGSTLQANHHQPVNEPIRVSTGQTVLSMIKAENSDKLVLKNQVKGSSSTTTCELGPEEFYNLEEDAKYIYGFSKTARVDDFWGDYKTAPCGVYINKTNSLDVGVVDDTRDLFCAGCGLTFYELDGPVPELELVPMIKYYGESYLHREIKFESYKDDYLTLYFLEKKGSKQGYDAQGNRENVKPEMFEKTQSFDLTESKTVEIMGAQIEIIEATPDTLVYKVLSPLASN